MSVLKRESQGYAVIAWQRALQDAGYLIVDDGRFGPITQGATVSFQRAYGCVPDGIVGPQTRAALVKLPVIGEERFSAAMAAVGDRRLCPEARTLMDAMSDDRYSIDGDVFDTLLCTARCAAFLAQLGHESGGWKYLQEIWGPTPAQRRYEGRRDLGNTEPGDGYRFRGRGYIQLTGRANYRAFDESDFVFSSGDSLLEENPDRAAEPTIACYTAVWFWQHRTPGVDMNAQADRNDEVGFKRITKAINGGLNGYADRVRRWRRVRKVLALV